MTTPDNTVPLEEWTREELRVEVSRLREELKCANALVVAKDNSYVSLQIDHEKAMFAAQFNSKQASELREVNAQSREYLGRVFKHHAPECEPLPTLTGVCMQIDNLSTLIPELRAKLARFEDREPLLQVLLRCLSAAFYAMRRGEFHETARVIEEQANAVSDFKVTP